MLQTAVSGVKILAKRAIFIKEGSFEKGLVDDARENVVMLVSEVLDDYLGNTEE